MGKRVLVAGIGNILLGDDGFGVEVVKRLAARDLPEGVEVKDFGIRGMDLAYALDDGYDLVVFVDATPRGGEPGTVYLIEPEIEDDGEASLDTHGMDPVKVIKLSRALGARPTRTMVVGCEPKVVLTGENYDDMLMELSEPVKAAVEEAADMVQSLVSEASAQKTGNLMPETCSLKPETFQGGETMKKLMFLGLAAGIAAVAVQWPEIHRYLKVRKM